MKILEIYISPSITPSIRPFLNHTTTTLQQSVQASDPESLFRNGVSSLHKEFSLLAVSCLYHTSVVFHFYFYPHLILCIFEMKSSKIEEELQGSPRTFVSEVGPVTSGPRGWRPKSGGQDSSFAFPGDPFEFQRQPGVIMSPSLSAYSRTSDSGRNRGGAQRQKVSYGYRRREDSHRSRSRSPVQARSDSPLFISDNEEGDEADDDKNDEHDEDDDAGSSFSLDPNEAPNPEPISERAENNCICPISLTCPARENNLIDCRTLVVEKQWWIERTEKTVKSM